MLFNCSKYSRFYEAWNESEGTKWCNISKHGDGLHVSEENEEQIIHKIFDLVSEWTSSGPSITMSAIPKRNKFSIFFMKKIFFNFSKNFILKLRMSCLVRLKMLGYHSEEPLLSCLKKHEVDEMVFQEK